MGRISILQFQSRNRGTCRFKVALLAVKKACDRHRFNLVIEVLVVSRAKSHSAIPDLSSFNLVIEVLVVSSHLAPRHCHCHNCGFNLVIEVLVVSRTQHPRRVQLRGVRFNLVIEVLVVSSDKYPVTLQQSAIQALSFNLVIEVLVVSRLIKVLPAIKNNAVSIS